MRLLRAWSAIASLLFTGTVMAASFDCSKARSATEKMICSDTVLSLLDEQLNAAYAGALSRIDEKAALKASQRRWLASLCRELTCATERFRERSMLLNAVAPSPWTGEYERYLEGRRDSDTSTLFIVGLNDGRLWISGLSIWNGPNANMGQVNTGEMSGYAKVVGQTAHYEDEESCTANLRRKGEFLLVSDEHGCGGLNVSFDGEYRKISQRKAGK